MVHGVHAIPLIHAYHFALASGESLDNIFVGPQDVNHTSNSAFTPWDNYTQEVIHPQWWPEGYTHHIKGHACYDPAKV